MKFILSIIIYFFISTLNAQLKRDKWNFLVEVNHYSTHLNYTNTSFHNRVNLYNDQLLNLGRQIVNEYGYSLYAFYKIYKDRSIGIKYSRNFQKFNIYIDERNYAFDFHQTFISSSLFLNYWNPKVKNYNFNLYFNVGYCIPLESDRIIFFDVVTPQNSIEVEKINMERHLLFENSIVFPIKFSEKNNFTFSVNNQIGKGFVDGGTDYKVITRVGFGFTF